MKRSSRLRWSASLLAGLLVTFTIPASAQDSLSDTPAPASKAAVAAPEVAPAKTLLGGLTFYSTRPLFNLDFPGLVVENWELGTVAPGAVATCPTPADSTSNNACFTPGQIKPGIRIDRSTGAGTTLAYIGAGFNGSPSKVLCSNTFADSTEMFFTNGSTFAVGMDVVTHVAAASVTVTVFGPGDVNLGSTTVAAGPAGTFLGIASTFPDNITRINLAGPVSVVEGGDNVAFGQQCNPAFVDGAEDGPNPFTTAGSTGAGVWNIVATSPHSGTSAWFIPDQSTIQDHRLTLLTPIVAAQSISFWKSHVFEAGFDGMVLEYSTNGGANWFDILAGNGSTIPANAARLILNGYNGTISVNFGSPIAGRQAWTAGAGVYEQVLVNLADFAGVSAQFRFRFASDSSLSAAGGRIDDITFRACYAKGDFQQNGHSDFLFRHDTSGENVVWYMDGVTLTTGTFTTPSVLADVRWKMVGTNDFNLDRKTDILWRHNTSGQNVVWFMNGVTLDSGGFTTPAELADTNWQMVGTGDFNQDGSADIMWRHDVSGENVVWFMNGTVLTSGTFLTPATLADTNWKMVGVSDFDRNGKVDILWRHNVSGQNVIWYMNGTVLVSGGFTTPSTLADTNWQMSAVGDYNYDGRPDIVFRHAVSGQNVVWYMGGADGSILTGGTFTNPSTLADTRWKLVGPR